MSNCKCPASMCPLIAPNGSPWTGNKDADCPEHDDIETKGCPWWSMACSVGGIHHQVDEAKKAEGKVLIVGPNKPKQTIGKPKTYECAKESVCSWNKTSAKRGMLCPPRYAMSLGLDPRVTLF